MKKGRTVRIKLPTIEQVLFSLEAFPEDIPVRGNAMASGNDQYDKEVEDEIIEKVQSNVWAWCYIKVTATYRGLKGIDTLGCCSYESEKDFIENSGYYRGMKLDAFDELIKQIEALAK